VVTAEGASGASDRAGEARATAPAAPSAGDRGIVRRLAGNSLVQIAASLATSGISFLTFIALTRALGPAAYGEFTAALAVILIVTGIADSGLSNSILREISARPAERESVLRTALPLRVAVSLAASGVIVVLGFTAPFTDGTRLAILIGSVGGLGTMMTFALVPVLQAELKMRWAAVANVVGRLVTLGITLGVLAAGSGLAAVAWAWAIGNVFTFVIVVYAVSRIVSLRPVFDARYWWELLRGSLVLGLAIGIAIVSFRTDTVLLALLRPESDVGLYSAAYKFVELAELVPYAVGYSVFPLLARLAETRDVRFHRLAQRTFDMLVAAAVPVAILLAALATGIVVLTTGDEFSEAGDTLRRLSPYPILAFAHGVLWRILMATGRDGALLATAAAALVVRASFNLALIPSYGHLGAATAAVAAEACGVAITAAVVARMTGYAPRLSYARVLLPAAAAMAAVVVFLPGPTLLAAAVGTALYAAIVALAPGAGREVVVRLAARA
jgi:O-antigen/teichoic acid export membrane protein